MSNHYNNISNNILLTHEIFDFLGKKKGWKYCFGALKIDMSKAYDRVDWKFLRAVLIAMNFNDNWITWIMECVTTVHYTLLISGNITKSFFPSKGLRQGDPLSLYLFLMCVNILSLTLMKAESQNRINGVKLGRNGCSFTHLFFVDDSIFFFKKDNHSLSSIKDILAWYCSIFGQVINLTKSDLYCSPNMPK